MSVTLAQFQTLAHEVGPTVSAVLAARVFAECERARVDAYIRPIFDSYGFTHGAKWGDAHAGERLQEPKDLYLADDEIQVAAYFEECDRAHRAHGFTGPKGHCPALTAEYLVVEAERALIDLTAPTFGIDPDALFLDHRATFLDLIITAAVKAGNVRNLFKEVGR